MRDALVSATQCARRRSVPEIDDDRLECLRCRRTCHADRERNGLSFSRRPRCRNRDVRQRPDGDLDSTRDRRAGTGRCRDDRIAARHQDRLGLTIRRCAADRARQASVVRAEGNQDTTQRIAVGIGDGRRNGRRATLRDLIRIGRQHNAAGSGSTDRQLERSGRRAAGDRRDGCLAGLAVAEELHGRDAVERARLGRRDSPEIGGKGHRRAVLHGCAARLQHRRAKFRRPVRLDDRACGRQRNFRILRREQRQLVAGGRHQAGAGNECPHP